MRSSDEEQISVQHKGPKSVSGVSPDSANHFETYKSIRSYLFAKLLDIFLCCGEKYHTDLGRARMYVFILKCFRTTQPIVQSAEKKENTENRLQVN